MALPLAKNRRVLDIACGEGYGSDLIAQVAHSVTGVELVASDADLPQLSASIYAGEYSSKPMGSLIGGIAERERIITELRGSLVQCESRIKDLYASNDETLSAVRDKLDASAREIAAKDIASKDGTINALRDLVGELDRSWLNRFNAPDGKA